MSSAKDLFVSGAFRIVNKPPRVHSDEVVTHGGGEAASGEVVEWKAAHRLDFETSGCLLLARADKWELYRGLFSSTSTKKSARKIYWAGSVAALPSAALGEAHGFIGGRYRSSKKVSFESVPARLKGFHGIQEIRHKVKRLTAAERNEAAKVFLGEVYGVELVTGARHQIRAWFAAQGAPLQGDPVYGAGQEGDRLELHARELGFTDPITGEYVKVTAPINAF